MTEQPHERFLTHHEPAGTILAAARAAQRIIDTTAELEQLRVHSVVIDDEGAVLEKVGDSLGYAEWHSTGERAEYEDDDVDLPAVVIYEPEETPNV